MEGVQKMNFFIDIIYERPQVMKMKEERIHIIIKTRAMKKEKSLGTDCHSRAFFFNVSKETSF